ncbi:hypothetical protein [Mesorhizobium sp. M0239]
MARLIKNRAGDLRSVPVVFDHNGMVPMVVTVGGDGTCHDNSIAVMMPAPMVIERYGTMAAVVQALTVFVDDLDAFVMSMMGSNNHIGFGCRSHNGQSKGKRQRAHDHCFHCSFSIFLISPSLDKLPLIALVPVVRHRPERSLVIAGSRQTAEH